MSPRRRREERKHWPKGLRHRFKGGIPYFFYRFLDGSEKWFKPETSEHDAVRLARMLENVDRNPEAVAKAQAAKRDKYNIPLRKALPLVLKKVKANKELGAEKLKTFTLDLKRLENLHGNVLTKQYNQEHVTEYLLEYVLKEKRSNLVYNTKLDFLRKVGKWLLDMSYITKNFAQDKAKLKLDEKQEQPLQLEHFQAIYEAAPYFLKVAMALSLNTTHAVQEMYKAKYRDCIYFDDPITDPETGLTVHGHMRIHRLKVEKKQASRVEIPITDSLLEVIQMSRADRIVSPYIVHKMNSKTKKMNSECDHWTQCSRRVISSTFSSVRDSLDLDLMVPNPAKKRGDSKAAFIKIKMNDADPAQKPGFHGIRGLAMRMVEKQGIDPQARAAHTDARSTKVYTENKIEWCQVPAVNMSF